MEGLQWLLCPACDAKTRVRISPDTRMENFPLYCPKCKRTTIISVREKNKITVTEPDA